MRFPHTCLLAAALSLSAPAVQAQNIRGQVVDSLTGNATAQAAVLLLDAGGAEIARTVTDNEGSFEFDLSGRGAYRLQVQRIGYRSWVFPTFTLERDEVLTANLVVLWSSAPAELEPVVVEAEAPTARRPLADFWERRETSGSGSFIAREEFEKKGTPMLPTDVLRRMAGVRVRTNPDYMKAPVEGDLLGIPTQRWRVTVGRAESRVTWANMGTTCSPLYFVDRHYLGTAAEIDIDAVLPLIDLEAVEAYGGLAVPREFAQRGFDCGVIVFWTR